MSAAALRGLYPILHSAFLPSGEIDVESFCHQVDFALSSGADGVVFPSLASEFFALDDAERRELAEALAERARGVRPFVIGVTSVREERAAALAAHAADLGATAVLALPPYPRQGPLSTISQYYRSIAEAAPGVPIILQNPRVGDVSVLGAVQIRELLDAVPNIRYIKDEHRLSSPAIESLLAQLSPRIDGVFGGSFGLTLVYDAVRGACGNMPGSSLIDHQVRVQRLVDTGQIEQAHQAQEKLQPLLDFLTLYPISADKYMMHKRGIFAHDRYRDTAAPPLDDRARADIDRLCRRAGVDA